MTEAISLLHFIIRVYAHSLERVQKQRKCPFTVRTASHTFEELICHFCDQFPLDTQLPAAYTTIMHPHQRTSAERVAVAVAQCSFRTGSDVCEDERRNCLTC